MKIEKESIVITSYSIHYTKLYDTCNKGDLSIAHNGNFSNSELLKEKLTEKGAIFGCTSDSELVLHLIAHSMQDTFYKALKEKNKEVAIEKLKISIKMLDSAAGKGIYHKNTVARKKSRMSAALAGIDA